jgi:hypothetical protein
MINIAVARNGQLVQTSIGPLRLLAAHLTEQPTTHKAFSDSGLKDASDDSEPPTG